MNACLAAVYRSNLTRRNFAAAGLGAGAAIGGQPADATGLARSQASGAPVCVHHEWGALEEVIVGIQPPDLVVLPRYYDSLRFLTPESRELLERYGGRRLIDIAPERAKRAHEQIDSYAQFLANRGINVHRTVPLHGAEANYFSDEGTLLFPRDPVIVLANNVIETSLKIRYRRKERYSVRPVVESLRSHRGFTWVSMPPPSPMADDADTVSAFLEGGDTLLNGREVYVGISGCASNAKGVNWLQRFLGDAYKVYPIELTPTTLHLDCVMSLVRPGLGVICPQSILGKLPGALRTFSWIEVSPEEAEHMGANGCILNEESLAIVGGVPRIERELRAQGQEVFVIPYDEPIAAGGGLRCSHHPLIRKSALG